MMKRNDGYKMLTDEDLLTEVLSRLPVKYLLRCKAVSKSWYSLISNPSFIKAHYQRHAITIDSAGDDNNATLIGRLFQGADSDLYFEEDGSYSLFRLGTTDDYIASLNFPFSRADYPFTPNCIPVGCVCGIVCVCVDPSAPIDAYYCFPAPDKATHIYIWNPATRQSKLIPSHALYDCDDTDKVALGFGFDLVDFDFKVVRVVSRAIFPQVYSANRDAWQNIETNLTDFPQEDVFHICLHGFLFTTGDNGMIAFDLNKEVFICDIKLPGCSNEPREECYDARIVDFKDSIAVITSDDKELSGKLNLWTLDDEACLRGGRVKALWTFMLSIDVGVHLMYVKGLFSSVEFLLVLVPDSEWFSYNFDKKEARRINTVRFSDFDAVFKYTENQQMLLVTKSKLVNWSDDEEDFSEEVSINLEIVYDDFIVISDDSEESN
ncbi:hypothetical protein ACET3Z_002381 [Daucus carota]